MLVDYKTDYVQKGQEELLPEKVSDPSWIITGKPWGGSPGKPVREDVDLFLRTGKGAGGTGR